MAEKNLYLNRLLSDPVCFADLVNGVLFGGERQLDPRDLTLVADSSGVVYAGPDGVRRTLERHRDVTMRAGDGQRFAVIALENQADVHYAMPVRSMLYDALDYVDQVRKITQDYRERGEKLTGSELLSGLRKGDRLVPVVTIVLYWGASDWDGCRSIHELLGLGYAEVDAGVDAETGAAANSAGSGLSLQNLAKYIPDYQINLVNAADPGELTRFHTHLQQIFSVIKYNRDKDQLYRYIHENREALRRMGETATLALASVIGEQKRLLKLLEEEGEEEPDMCKAIDDLIADGEARGKAIGEARGEARGFERLSTLISKLLDENRPDLIRQVTSDKSVREQLFRSYGL